MKRRITNGVDRTCHARMGHVVYIDRSITHSFFFKKKKRAVILSKISLALSGVIEPSTIILAKPHRHNVLINLWSVSGAFFASRLVSFPHHHHPVFKNPAIHFRTTRPPPPPLSTYVYIYPENSTTSVICNYDSSSRIQIDGWMDGWITPTQPALHYRREAFLSTYIHT